MRSNQRQEFVVRIEENWTLKIPDEMREALKLYPDDSLVFRFFEGDNHGHFRVARGMQYYAASWDGLIEWSRERRRHRGRIQGGDGNAE